MEHTKVYISLELKIRVHISPRETTAAEVVKVEADEVNKVTLEEGEAAETEDEISNLRTAPLLRQVQDRQQFSTQLQRPNRHFKIQFRPELSPVTTAGKRATNKMCAGRKESTTRNTKTNQRSSHL